MKEQDNPTPGSGDGGSIKMDPSVIKEDPEGATVNEHDSLGMILSQPNGHTDSIPDIKPKLEDLAGPRSVSGQDLVDAHTPQQQATPQDGHTTPSSQAPGSNAPRTPSTNTPNTAAPTNAQQQQQGGMPNNPLQQQQQNPGGQPGQPSQANMPMDSHFMQQQSQIFVFSTSLANEAAEAVQSGQCKSVIDYHMKQPGTKQFLQKHPLKIGQFNRPPGGAPPVGPGSGPNDRTTNKPGMMGEGGNSLNSVAQWVQHQNATMQQGPGPGPAQSPSFSPTSFPQGSVPGNGQMGWQGPGGPPGGPSGPGPSPFNMGQDCGGPSDFMMMMDGPNGQMNNMNNMPPGSQPNLLQNKVPNENLTPEQRHRREEQLANLQKIKMMLFPEGQQGMGASGPPNMGPGGPSVGPGGPGMGPGGPGPGMMHGPAGCASPGPGSSMFNSMPPGPGGMIQSQPNMMGSPPGMMGNNPMGGPGPGFMGPGLPHNWDSMTPAQRDWFKLQQEFYMDKRNRQMHQMQQMHMPRGAPPPPYFMRRGGMPGPMSPTSPNFTSGPMRGPSPLPNDPNFMMSGPRLPGPGGMNFPPGAGPHGPNFDPAMDGGMQGPGGMFPFKDDMMRPPGPGGNSLPIIQRAGNPEQFHPEGMGPPTPTSNTSGPTKPPPPYGQAQKRKRSADDFDDLYRKLQPAPSPQQFSYMNQFEGQELTITKQLNTAYQEPSVPSPATQVTQGGPASARPPSTQSHPAANSKEHAAASPMPASSSSVASASVSSPLPTSMPNSRPSSVSGLASQQGPGSVSSNTSGGPNSHGRLGGHFDLLNPNSNSAAAAAALNSSVPSSTNLSSSAVPSLPSGPKGSSLTSNITSSSLANLAKDVEQLSNQMQQNMMQGGPFHNIQMQGQMSDGGGDHSPPPPNSVLSNPGASLTPGAQSAGAGTPQSHPGPPNNNQPSVNNTYVNATMSIGQLNIQSVNQPGYNASMQVQQMNSDIMTNMAGAGGPAGSGPASGAPGPPASMAASMSHQQSMMAMNGDMPAGKFGPGPGPSPGGMPAGPMANRPGPNGPPGPMPNQPGFPSRHPSPSLSGYQTPTSPSGGPAMGNANVQIQAKAPNTIQYLPANPPSSQAAGPMAPGANRKDMDMMPPRFPSPIPMESGRMSGVKFPFGPANDMMPMGMNGPPGGPAGPRMSMSPGMSMQQSMMMQSGSMQQSMGRGMPYNSMGGPGMGPNVRPGMGPGPGPGPGPMMSGEMMQGQMQMQSQQMSMHSPHMMGGMPSGPGMHPGDMGPMGPGQPNGGPGYGASFQQFQQQIYASGRPRQMNPGPGPMNHGPMGPGMGPNPGMMSHSGGMPSDMMGPGPMSGPGAGPAPGPGPGPGMPNMGHPGMMNSGPGPGGPGPGMMNSGGMSGMMPNML